MGHLERPLSAGRTTSLSDHTSLYSEYLERMT